jgi:PKHD-type hydroxylase
MKQNWQMWSGVIQSDVIDAIKKRAEDVALQDATIFSGEEKNDGIRRSQVKWLSHDNATRQFLWQYIQQANRNAFGFDIDNVGDIQYTEYDEADEGHYDWHHDINWAEDRAYSRKLSITVQLTGEDDYEGGEFSFCEVQNPNVNSSKKLGTVLVFPSYLQHKVAPVTKGKRISLVGWFEGPRWK